MSLMASRDKGNPAITSAPPSGKNICARLRAVVNTAIPTNNQNDTAPRSIPTPATRKRRFQTCPYNINKHPGSTNTPTTARHQTTTNNPTHPLIPRIPGSDNPRQPNHPTPPLPQTRPSKKSAQSVVQTRNIRASIKDEFKIHRRADECGHTPSPGAKGQSVRT